MEAKEDSFRFGLVAGEESGDILGADLILALKKIYPQATFIGIGGARMIAAGMESLYPLERLSVMGFIEPLKRLPELLKIRSHLKKYFIQQPPAVFIGIDAPDFNLSLEHSLKKQGIRTVHYVSPTVWAWRKGRIHKIKKAINRMLCLFPFETQIYQAHSVPNTCVGHPLADAIPLHFSQAQARNQLNLPSDKKIVALLPGSRRQELVYLAKDFIETARWLKKKIPDIEFISPSANENTQAQFQEYLQAYDDITIKLYPQQMTLRVGAEPPNNRSVCKIHEDCEVGESNTPEDSAAKGIARTVMAAADVVLTVSGTASLEAMLVKRPTIVAYKMSKWGFALAKKLIKVPYIALPNLLAGKLLMKEFIQDDVNPAAMGSAILEYLQKPELSEEVSQHFLTLHQSLRKNAGLTAANAIVDVIKENQ